MPFIVYVITANTMGKLIYVKHYSLIRAHNIDMAITMSTDYLCLHNIDSNCHAMLQPGF